MRKWIYLVLVIILVLNMAGYALKVSTNRSIATLPEVALPETVQLNFTPLELMTLKAEKPKENWEFIKSMSFGAIENEPVELSLFQEGETDNILKAQLKYKAQAYTLNGDVSSGIFQYGINEVRHGPITKTSYLIEHQYENKENQIFLLGGIELYANGPGLVAYLAYDMKNNTWFQFEEWGIPYLADIDTDSSKELTIQFPGLHMQAPDVQIIRWDNGKLEKSESFKAALGINSYQPSIVNVVPEENMHFAVEVNMSGETDKTNLVNALYKYEKGKLIKIK